MNKNFHENFQFEFYFHFLTVKMNHECVDLVSGTKSNTNSNTLNLIV